MKMHSNLEINLGGFIHILHGHKILNQHSHVRPAVPIHLSLILTDAAEFGYMSDDHRESLKKCDLCINTYCMLEYIFVNNF